MLGDASAASQVVGAFGTSDIVQFDASLSGTIVVTNNTLSATNLTKGFELRGPGASVLTIQNQTGNNARFLTLDQGDFTVSGLTITDFVGAGGDGGAIRLPGPNTANLIVDRVWFLNNKAQFGGAIDVTGNGNLTITNSTFSGNQATINGGAIWYGAAAGFSLTITNSTFSGNTADDNGGAIRLGAAATATIRASTIVNNTADADGNSTGTGGGISVNLGSNLTLISSIVANNKAGTAFSDIDGAVVTAGSTNNLVGTSQGLTGITNGTAGNFIGTPGNEINPFVGPLQNNGGPTPTHALLAGSKAINAGISIMGFTTDQRGFARITGPAPDIGAFETNARWLQQGVVGNNDNGGLEQYNFTIGNNPFTPN
jgi:predicted outer membrane repeat protein